MYVCKYQSTYDVRMYISMLLYPVKFVFLIEMVFLMKQCILVLIGFLYMNLCLFCAYETYTPLSLCLLMTISIRQ